MTRAQATPDSSKRIKLYEEAIAQCRSVAETSSNSCAAQTVWAICLVDLAQVVTQRLDSADYAHQAQARLAKAEQCAPQSWLVQQTWGRLLLAEAERQESAPKAASRLLEQARQRFEKARQAAAFKSDRADAEFNASQCLMRLAQQAADSSKKLALYRETAGLCESAAQVPGYAKLGQVHGLWGVALLETGKLDGQRRTLRRGVEHLQTALKLTADDLRARYNLACAYALLEQFDLAFQELRTCVESDPTGKYRKSAQTDEDFVILHRRADFRKLMRTRGAVPVDQPPSN